MDLKLLRRSGMLAALLAMAGFAFAQSGVQTNAPTHTLDYPAMKADMSDLRNADLKQKQEYTNWFSPADAVASSGGSFSTSVFFLYPDSMAKWVGSNGSMAGTFHIAGTVFDPNFFGYELVGDGIKLSRWNKYTVDSIAFRYLYVRNTDSVDLGAGNVYVTDTMIVKFYDASQLTYWYFDDNSNVRNIFAQPTDMDKDELGSPDAAYELKIPLTNDDSTIVTENGWRNKLLTLSIPDIELDMAQNSGNSRVEVCGFSIAFKTMIPFELGDTLFNSDLAGPQPSKKLNYFGYLQYGNSGAAIVQTEDYNNSFFTNSALLYGYQAGSLGGYFPSIFWNSNGYLYSAFHITTPNLSVENVGDNLSVSVYPNPVNKTQNLKMDVNLINAGNVAISMYDLLGNKVKDVTDTYYPAGEHGLDLNISDLTPGVYFYTIQAGNASTTKKVTIVD